jgi:hypothetical protein
MAEPEAVTPIRKEECPACHYVMTKPFEWRCPICIVGDEDRHLPVDPTALLGGAAPAAK